MIPAAFDYTVAENAEHAIQLLGEYGDEAKILAGGHSLIPMMKFRLATPTQLIDVGRISDLSYINQSNGHVAIGAMTKHKDCLLYTSPSPRDQRGSRMPSSA